MMWDGKYCFLIMEVIAAIIVVLLAALPAFEKLFSLAGELIGGGT